MASALLTVVGPAPLGGSPALVPASPASALVGLAGLVGSVGLVAAAEIDEQGESEETAQGGGRGSQVEHRGGEDRGGLAGGKALAIRYPRLRDVGRRVTRGHADANHRWLVGLGLGLGHGYGHQLDPGARESLDLAPGTAVGRYTVLARVGAGAMGVVFEAFDRDLDRRVAVKLLRRAQSAELLREAQAMAKLAHPHVVAVYDVGTVRITASTQVFVAMEFLPGGTLGDWLGERDHDLDGIVEVFLAAGEGLAEAHRAGLVHRDFKPENVLMTSSGLPKVTDFGLAASSSRPREPRTRRRPEVATNTATQAGERVLASASVGESTQPDPDMTHEPRGRWCGTPAYMAPEQFRGGEASERSDQWSFCVALYEAVYGERPFSGTSLFSLGVAICQNKRNPTPTHVVVPRRLLDAIERGLAPDPANRFADMDDLLDALRPPVVKRSAGWTVGIVGLSVAVGLGIRGRVRGRPADPDQPRGSLRERDGLGRRPVVGSDPS